MEGVWDLFNSPENRREQLWVQTVSEQEGQGGRKGEGGRGSLFFFFLSDSKGGGDVGYVCVFVGWGLEAAIPAQCRRDSSPDVPLRFGTGHRERGEMEEHMRVGGGELRERPCLKPLLH